MNDTERGAEIEQAIKEIIEADTKTLLNLYLSLKNPFLQDNKELELIIKVKTLQSLERINTTLYEIKEAPK